MAFTLDDQPPTLTITGPSDNTFTNANVDVTGTVTDNLSGVFSLTAQVDSGTPTAVNFDSTTGAFSFETSLKTDGTADGKHTVALQSYDGAGNVLEWSTSR